jgi:hypothetical protein
VILIALNSGDFAVFDKYLAAAAAVRTAARRPQGGNNRIFFAFSHEHLLSENENRQLILTII